MKVKRIMIAAASSGSGKTLITCGLLGALKNRGLKPASFKCGPDFIDPMFHTKVLGTKSRNLDTFFAGDDTTRMLLCKNSVGADISVMEGVMGYYDGLAIDSSRAGASDLAGVTDTPVLLIVNAKGASRSVLPMIKGFLGFQEKPCIKGIILNRISPMLYPSMKEMIERELQTEVVGYLPVLTDCILESRHLGLMMPDEITSLQEKLGELSAKLEKTLDIDRILELADAAPDIAYKPYIPDYHAPQRLRIALARDEAFCFFYEDNLALLREMGAELVPFSPIHDKEIPENIDGILLHGGYPELYLKELSENETMLSSLRNALSEGIPCMAECGGFLYLHDSLSYLDGTTYKMAGVIPARAFYNGKLTRFGYITLDGGTMFGQNVGPMRSHEFHYFESEQNGDAYRADKPSGKRNWRCINSTETLFAGFPHLYYYANPKVPAAFLQTCARRKQL